MTPGAVKANDAASRLWARAAGDVTTPEDISAAADRMCEQLSAGLGRWIGKDGYRALLERALGLARAQHLVLSGVSCMGGDASTTAAAVKTHGARAVAAGMVAWVTELIALLGAIIGEEMAVRLVEQMGPSRRPVVSTRTQGEHDG